MGLTVPRTCAIPSTAIAGAADRADRGGARAGRGFVGAPREGELVLAIAVARA